MSSDTDSKIRHQYLAWILSALAVIVCLAWGLVQMEIDLHKLAWRLGDFLLALLFPAVAFYAFVRVQKHKWEAGNHRRGFIGLVQHPAVRAFLVFIFLPAVSWLAWDLRKRELAKAGPTVNASITAIYTVKDFIKMLASLVLLPLVSMVTAAHQARDPARVLQVVGAGLGIGLVAGMAAEAIIIGFAPQLLGLFEGREQLLPESPFLCRVSSMAFVFTVLNDGLIGTLAGLTEYMAIGECLIPPSILFLLGGVSFSYLKDLTLLMAFPCVIDAMTFIILFLRVRVAISSVRREAQGTAPSGNLLGSLRDFVPSGVVLRSMLVASGNTGMRNCTLRLQGMIMSMYATRLGNVHGSLWTIYATSAAYLGGPCGLTGIFTANVAPRLLEIRFFSSLVKASRYMVMMLLLAAGVWTMVFAYHGAPAMLWWGGISMGDLPQNVSEEARQYLEVMTGPNHCLWVFGVVCSEIAAPFDGFLVTLGAYNAIGAVYGVSFFLVFWPALYLTHDAGMQGHCPLPASMAPSGCNSMTAAVVPTLAWCMARFVGIYTAMFAFQYPQLKARRDTCRANCSRELVYKYMRSRAELPDKELQQAVDLLGTKSGIEKEIFRFRAGGPMDAFATSHGSSAEVLMGHFIDMRKTFDATAYGISQQIKARVGDDFANAY